MGFEVQEHEQNQNYSIKIYMADEAATAGHWSDGVPDQSAPVWDPTIMKPDMQSYETYSRRGYGYL